MSNTSRGTAVSTRPAGQFECELGAPTAHPRPHPSRCANRVYGCRSNSRAGELLAYEPAYLRDQPHAPGTCIPAELCTTR